MLLLESTARDIILVPGVDTRGIEMYTESTQIAELFKDPKKIQRSTPFNRVISKTFGSPKRDPQQQMPGDPGPPAHTPKKSAPRSGGFY